MKYLRDLLKEARKREPVRVKPDVDLDVKDKPGVNLDFDLNGPKTKGELATPQAKPGQKQNTGRKTATAQRTWQQMGNVRLNPNIEMPEINTDEVDMDDEISDEEARQNAGVNQDTEFNMLHQLNTPGAVPEPRIPETLPAVISKAMAKSGTDLANIEPEWHMVKHLPGYLAAPIRAIGRKVFAPFTKTPIEDIQVLANLGGGPNSEAELNAVTRFISSRGRRDDAMEIEFQRVIPSYGADVVIYNCEGYTFFLVRDFAGQYIYSWPEKDSKDVFGTSAVDKRLGRERKVPRLQ